MTVKVYIWEKQKDQGTVGHASMSLSDGTHISWWPKDEISKDKTGKQLSSPAIQGQTLEADISFEECDPVVYTLDMCSADEKKIKTWWTNFTAKNDQYHLLTMNCSTVVYMALKEVYPSLKLLGAVTPIWTPGAIEMVVKLLGAGVTDFSDGRIQELKSQFSQLASQYTEFLNA